MPGSVERAWNSAGSLHSFRALLIRLHMAVITVTTTGENCQMAAKDRNACTHTECS